MNAQEAEYKQQDTTQASFAFMSRVTVILRASITNEAAFQRCFLENRLCLTCEVNHDRTNQSASAEGIYFEVGKGKC